MEHMEHKVTHTIVTKTVKHTVTQSISSSESNEESRVIQSHETSTKAITSNKATSSIAGFFVEHIKEKVSIYQALLNNLVSDDVALALLEAQAATGNIMDITKNQLVSVEAAIEQGLASPEHKLKLISAHNAVTGYKYKDETLSLFHAFKKGLIDKYDAIRFLEAQVATGGIIDHVSGHRMSLSEALKHNGIDEEMFKILSETTESTKRYTDPNTQEDSTYQQLLAKCIIDAEIRLPLLPLQDSLQGLRKPVTLEQLFNAKIIDQTTYDEIKQGKQTLKIVGERQEVQQYLLGSKIIGGVYIQSTKEKMNIYQAMKQNFLTSDTAVALLEAQAATGFLIDAVSNAKLSVTEAIQKGLVGLELKEKLLTAERSVLGFNDPYTGKGISLFQAIKKELIEKNQGLNLLEVLVATGGIIDPVGSFRVPVSVAYKRGLFDKEMDQLISDSVNGPRGFLDPNTDEHVTYLELQKRCMLEPDTKLYLLPLVITFQGLRGNVTSEELLDSLIIDKTSYEDLQHGNISVQEVAERETVQQYLEGTGCIAGIAIISTNDRKSIYQAMKEHMLLPGTSMALLEAQAATGYLVDPVKNVKFSVDDAVKHGLIGPEVHEKLLSAERAVIGYKDPYTGDKLSLFQAIKKDFIAKDHGISLLEAQIATGGIIDPVKKHRVPEEIAYKRGYFDKEMNNILKNASDETKFFFDPNSKENVTYAQLLKRCVIDFHSGLYLIPLFDNTQDELKTPHTFIDYQIQVTLKEIKITLESGKYKGQTISLWKLLFSDYFTVEQRESLIKLYKTGNLSIEELSSKITTDIKQLVSTTKVTFKGLRENVTPGQLLNSEIINKDLYEKLEQGKTSAKDVVNIESVRKYLQGTESISGLILTENQEKISIYQAKRKGILRPGTSLILLEAQAATGFVIDPVENKKYSVDEALKANVIGPEFYEKLLSAEKSVTGYHDPYTEEIISLFQAMNKELIVKDHGIRLLEAQIATGGIIDPINSHRIPVEVAYKRGYFDKKMHAILSDPSDDTKGFFDPNTNENLTYLQLKEKCITEPSTNLCLLPLHSKKFTFQINDYVRNSFRNLEIHVKYGRFRGQTVSAWVLINSEYFSEWKRRELIEMYRLRKATLEQITLLIQEEMKKWAEITFPAIRGDTNIYHLLEAEIIDKDLFEQVLDGKIGAEDILKMEKVQKHLHGSGVLGGIIIQPSNQKINFYEAAKKNILLPSTVLPLLEAQAASGYIIDPVTNQKLSVDEALKAGVISPQVYDKLRVAEEAVTGYKDPYTGNKISLFQAMQKGLVEENHATQLLDAQLATGGIIDPVNTFHLPDKVAYKYGYFNEEMHKRLLNPTDSTKLYYDPTTKEMVTYSELISRSEEDKSTGIHLLPVPQEFVEVPLNNIYSDEEVRKAFKSTKIEERNMTLWDLIHSGYFTEEQRYHILEKYKSKKATIQELTIEILQIVRDNEIKVTTHISFEGIRGKVPAVNLLELGIISQQTFDDLVQGKTTIEEVSKINIVKKCLEGTGCISGVFLQPTKEKMSIYQAIKRNLILPANGLMLLEAQAATGFMIDPTKNQKYSVDSAVKASVIGPELHEKLLTAESALTGYTDPYTGNKISLGQAITKQLIANKEGIPLLQAQIAAGGIIDPIHKYYVPIKLAFKLGFIDEDVAKATENLKVYFDPNTKESLTYLQLKETCFKDIETGHLLLSISENPAIYAESHIIEILKSVNINVQVGRFKGQTLSVWDLLNSEYITMNKFKELLSMYTNGSSAVLQDIVKIVSTIIEETSTTSKKIKFKGLRKQVSASDLFESNVIDKKTLDELNQGKKTITEVTEMDNVKRYLQGTNCIAGILIQSTNKKMSIYEAMLKRILRPGTALVLLEAQAATGYIIDPVKNQKLSVDEAMAQGLIGHDIYNKLLSAEQAVTGYTDPYTGEKISLFQALNKNLIVDCHAIRLLEAQIATGGIIDPVHSHRVPVEVAYKRGYFNEEMNKILSDPSDDTKGFFDPNTHENLTYLQLVDRCIQDPETGLYLLQVVKKGENYFYITDKMKEDLRSKTIQMQFGLFANQTVSIWEILCSQYITELKRRELVKLYAMGVLAIEQLISTITTLMHEFENKSSNLKFKGIRAEVTATDLFNAEVIDKKILDDLKEGKKTVDTVAQMDSVKRYLEGTSCIAGIVVSPSNETVSISEAMGRGILARDVGLLLLQAQVATGFLIDPTTNKRFSVAEALSAGLINSDVQGQLEIAEKSVTGFTDPMTSSKISLFQAIKKNLVAKEPSIYLLEAQMATGGIFDPIYSHRLPLEVAYKKHYLDEDTYILVSDDDGKKGFVDPNTHQKITYKHLIERCTKDPKTGMHLLQIAEKRDDYFYVDEPTKHILMSVVIKMSVGRFQGQEVSLWELLCSEYISEEKRKELIKKYKTDTTSILKDIINIILSIIQEKETNQKDIWFQGLRKQITASELYEAEIISKDTLEKLRQEMETASDVAKTDSVKRYLEGTSSIAGIFVNAKKDPSQRKKMQIYEAMIRNILRPGTALVLLEAQAATGFVIDCIKNKKYSVEEALSAGLIGYEIYNKLLSAERGVTGYTDPYTGEKISLFQAMQKDLIVKEHGIRLLEAQIATGGIIDPVHSHRVPLEVAYKRGYFDEEMNQILSDPSDDTKGFFDPNTHENLTYMQLFQRCIQDPDTGLYMLEVNDKKSSQQTETQTILKSKTVQITVGEFQGKNVTFWELLHSKYISVEKREELLKKYRHGDLSLEELLTIITTIITQTEISQLDATDSYNHNELIQSQLQSQKVKINIGDFNGQTLTLWELLNSHYITEEKRKEVLEKLKSGTLTIQEIVTTITTIITEAELKKSEQIEQSKVLANEQTKTAEHSLHADEIQKALQSISIPINKGQFQAQEISVWDFLNSRYVKKEKREELLGNYKLTVQDIIAIVIKTLEVNSKLSEKYNVLKTNQVEVSVGESKGQKMSVWDLLTSRYISEEKKVELLENLNSGKSDVKELIKIVSTIIEETEERSKKLKFKGLRRQVTATELLTSEIIDQKTLTELTQGNRTIDEVTKMDKVKRYLEGTSSIAGVLVPSIRDPSKIEKMSIYDAMQKRILRPGTALVLLEAQAATGFVIDPIKNKKLSVDEAVTASLVGQELHGKLLSAEKAVTGYKDPYTGDKISLFQAMQKDLIVKDHGIRLLEAQIATGGIIDPVHSHRVPVEVAYKRGYFDEEMNQILSDPSDDTKGFFDPNTHENLTYMQLLERCNKDPRTGLYMLEVRYSKPSYFQIDKKIESTLQSKTIHIKVGRYKGQNISIWELLNSQYLLEKRLDLLKKYQSGSITIEELIQIITTIIEETENKTSFGDVNGSITDQSQQNKDAVQTTKQNQQTILQSHLVSITKGKLQGQKISLWDLLNSAYITEVKKHELLQKYTAGTLTLEDMIQIIITLISQTDEKTVTIEQKEFETTNNSLQLNISTHTDEQLKNALSAIKVIVQPGQFQEQRVSLWEVLNSKYIPANERDVQLKKHQTSVKELKQVITDLVEVEEAKSDQEIQNALEKKTAEVAVGEFKGQSVSLWVLLHSKYVSEEKRKELLEKYKHGELTEEEILRIIIKIIEEIEERSRNLKFKGLRRQITATELLQSEIIDQSTMNELTQGSRTVEQVTQMDSVKRYLEGTSCIAGVFVTSKKDPSKREKINIYEAMLNRILRPGSALILLEAQAATGFVIDSIQNKKLSVDEALSAGLIGYEIYNKLLSAEKGVTGYTDPYSGEKISLFQAMQKDLIVKEHGIRLLEAQIATGGIIDPVHSHRVPVEVAYKRGYFDEEMNQILSDPSDDTKGFFDPNTHENLTYMQLLQRCIQDPGTGLYMLDVKDSKSSFHQTDIQSTLKSKIIQITTGQFQGKNISIWELLNSKYISEGKREELLKKYRTGTLSMDELITIVTTIITETEVSQVDSTESFNHNEQIHTLLQSQKVDVSVGDFKGQCVTLWELLNSRYIAKEQRNEILEKMKVGTLSIQEVITLIITIITESELKRIEQIQQFNQVSVEQSKTSDHSIYEDEIKKALQSISIHIKKGQFQGQEISVWDLLQTSYITEEKRQELLGNYKLTVQDIITIVIKSVDEVENQNSSFKTEYKLNDDIYNNLKTVQVEISVGEYKGKKMLLWDLLMTSKYISEEKKVELFKKLNSGKLDTNELIKVIITIIEETEEKSKKLKFKGLRRQVTATELLTSEIIDQKTLTELTQGKKTVEEVTQMDTVKRYLEGTSCIAGVLVPSIKHPSKIEKMSIYDAKLKHVLRPGTALVLLEAQAATGFVIDPIKNKKLSVDEAVTASLVGQELHGKLLSAEKAVTGYKDPYTGDKISLFQAMQKDLIVKDHGIRLLEAQIATGGIIDPVHSHRVPVEVAYKRGYFDEEMNQILSDPSDDTKGFFDPNTHENLTYMQLLERCIKDPDTGLYMLDVKNSKPSYFQIDKKIESTLQSKTIHINVGKYTGQNISVWELLNSQYLLEKRLDLLKKYQSGSITIEELIQIITTIIEETENKTSFGDVNGSITDQSQQNKDAVQTTKQNQQTILQSHLVSITKGKLQGQKISLWDLLNSAYITEDKKHELLQKYTAGTLTLEDMIQIIITLISQTDEKTVTIEQKEFETTNNSLQLNISTHTDEQLKKALSAIKVSVQPDQFQEQRVSLWEVLNSKYIPANERDVQLKKHQTSVKELKQVITDLVEVEEAKSDQEIQNALEKKTAEVAVGEFKGQSVSLWVLLHSKYVSEEKGKELLEKYKHGELTEEEILRIIIKIIEEIEERSRNLKFKGLRRQITATELLQSEIIDQSTMNELTQGSRTVEQVTQMDSVKRYLEGTSCIAGVFVTSKKDPSKREKINIYEAMLNRILRPGSALILLEAQAATGFVIDSIQNKKLSVDEALSAGLIGYEIYNKLLSAEKGVTGYTDPYSGEKISLFQAMQKDLIVKEHGIRLLEAQIATGGIIDPVHSHRVPVEVAYKRGYFDEEMNQILSDPSDDTKGFFDPNTHENLTYMQLLQRCIQDPGTGLYMLDVKDSKSSFHQTDIQSTLKSKIIQITTGQFQGKNISIWELLNSKYISEEKREELLKKYRTGTLSMDELITIVTTIITETEVSQVDSTESFNHNEQIHTLLQSQKVDVSVGDFKGQCVTLWELLNSRYIAKEQRNEILEKMKVGTLSIQEVITLIITIITESELKRIEQIQQFNQVSAEQSKTSDHSIYEDEIKKALQSISIHITKGQFQGQEISVWDLLQTSYITEEKRQELLGNYKLTVQDIITIVIKSVDEVENQNSSFKTEYKLNDDIYNNLKTVQVEISVGEYKGKKMLLWDLLMTSKYISEEKKVELFKKLNSGKLDTNELIKVIITIIEETEEKSKKLKFKGLRRQVTATELLTSEIIDQKTLTELTQGKKTVEEVTQMDTVKRYLEGTSCIAGVLVPSIKHPSKIEKMSIYDAKLKRVLRPGTALVLLEAQAATGFVIDPIKNKKLSVDEAVTASLVGQELHGKLLSAEKAVTGYKDPYTGDKISLFQAMQKDLIVKDHGIRLLEAQIATGGIIDPVHSHRVPVEVAYKRGYFDEEMNQILSDPSDDTKGFFDPNTHENLTYMQLLERCIKDPDTGLYMLDVKNSKPSYFQIDKKIESTLQSKTIHIKVGKYTGQNISIWELLNSQYLLEKRLDLLKKYQSGSVTIEELIQIIITIIEETENKTSFGDVNGSITDQSQQNKDAVQTTKQNQQTILQSHLVSITKGKLQGQKISLWDLLNSAYITEDKKHELLQKYTAGTLTLEDMIQIIITLISQTDEKTVTIEQKEFETTNNSLQLNISTHTDEQLKKALSAIKVSVQPGQFQEQRVSLWEVLNSKCIPANERDVQLKNHQTSVKELKQAITELVEVEEAKSDQEIQNALEKKTAEVAVGEFKGQSVSLWVLLHSKYVSEEKRKELLEKYKHGELTEEEILRIFIKIIEEIEERSRNLKFKGLRRQITATELLQSEIIDQSTMNELTQGSRTVEQVTQMDSVKRYLEGTSCIAGVFVTSKKDPSKREKINIYEAMLNRILRPGSALILLEAQAATGFVIDSKQNKKLSVDEALSAGLIGHEIYNKLLSAEKGVTGYTDPYSGEKISLFQAMQKDLIVKEHGIRLLEAQIATGGIIDPVHSHRVPVEVAYKRGYFDEEMSQILSDPSDDTKGFFDPNTHENLTYMQLLQRCIYDTETDLYMLDVNRSPLSFSQAEDKTNKNLQSKTIQITTGQFQGKNVSVWELLHSKYLSIEKQEELLKRYRSGALSIDELIVIITTIINDAEKVASVNQKVEVQKSLQSVQIDISVGSSKEKSMSVWDVINSEYIVEKEREELLEKFQSGTLTLEELIKIIITNIEKKTKHVTKPSQITVPEITITSHSVEDWPSDEQFQRALQVIPCDMSKQNEKESVSVWELLHNQNVSEDERQKLLLTCKHTAQEVMTICTNIIKTGEERDCSTESFAVDEQTQSSLKAKMVEVSSGELKGQLLSVWDLLHSKYISVEKSKDLLLAHIFGTLTLDEMIKMIITILEESLEKSSQLKFKGLRRQVTATELLISEIIDQKTLTELTQGSKTLEEVTQMDSVKRYLEGTSCIAGVFVPAKQNPSKREKISIYQAMWKNILRPGTALVLLEAQAATGFIIDPINNKKLSVDEAVSAGVVGKELHAKLLSAERAVTGYNDPYTSKKISLFQAMKKNLIVKDHGIRLLEAQIATGGIIDPIHSHRVPVEVAYKRGYFDEEMSQILSDPTDDTKGFFDPNTHENLTYMQLLQRCMQDTETGLSMLEVKESKSSYFHIDQTIKNALQSKTVQYQGQNVSLWEIFNSQYVLEDEKVRQELLTQYKSGTLTIEQLMARIAEITEKSEHKSHSEIKSRVIKGHGHPHKHGIEQMEQSQNLLKSVEVEITFGKHKGKKLSLLQLLDSKDITSEKKRELLEKYENGVLSLEELINYITELTMEKETRDKTVSRQDKTVKDGESTLDFLPEPIQKSLQSFYVPNSVGEFQQQNITLWEVLHYSNISNEKRQYLLTKYYLTIQEIISVITKLLQSTEKTSTLQIREDTAKFLMSVTVQVNTGEFKIEGKSHTLWELLHSKYITKEKRKELLEKFESKTLTWEEIFNIIVTIIKETEERGQKLKFKGLRRQVTASELLQSEIIDQNTLTELTQGKKTLAEVTKMDSVKRYLEGTSCIAGIIVQSKNDQSKTEKMSIYNAMLKRILRPGTALVLLEAQAATGFIIDPMKNTKLAVDEAVAARVIGQELYSKLLSAERAVTGYNDPTTGEKISLFQAMQKDLIVKDHGIRLLEAQIATGGIIDPVHSHRVPVDVAYKRGFFDEEMNQILSDPTDDTKGFFDPNTHENLTYMQLLQRCKQDPETGLCMLVVISK
ncbi:epiplakin [Bombina bombina]|uniref:epiplakin n=1 Tax=Bombina bombina TaxID=8345 RepID=UPI00235AED6F|nr:epiplakin [Bombina bombina]